MKIGRKLFAKVIQLIARFSIKSHDILLALSPKGPGAGYVGPRAFLKPARNTLRPQMYTTLTHLSSMMMKMMSR